MIGMLQRPIVSFPASKRLQTAAKSSSRSFTRLANPAAVRPARRTATRALFNMFGGSGPTSSVTSLHELKVETAMGDKLDLSTMKGKVVMVFNSASRCGLTSQLGDLAKLDEKYQKTGLFKICAQPCNQFGGQEPGTNAEICDFAANKYNAKFTFLNKGDVNGSNTTPLYAFLKGSSNTGNIGWNFGKFLVGKDGKVIKYYAPTANPMDAEADIIAALKA